jgi:hypothetical protein
VIVTAEWATEGLAGGWKHLSSAAALVWIISIPNLSKRGVPANSVNIRQHHSTNTKALFDAMPGLLDSWRNAATNGASTLASLAVANMEIMHACTARLEGLSSYNGWVSNSNFRSLGIEAWSIATGSSRY